MVAAQEPDQVVGSHQAAGGPPADHRGRHFLDDVQLTGLCHAAVVRSPYAHARIVGIDADAARRDAGRRRPSFTGEDLAEVNPLPCAWQAAGRHRTTSTPPACSPSARSTRSATRSPSSSPRARLATRRGGVAWRSYDELPVVVDARKATEPALRSSTSNAPNNVV
jgi:carbon-monoxide dehydrogenase large subunit